ncbi:MAG: radical SAM protein [Candidatus Aminicenantes bacterium]|nr:radical SAM protein [Candidatus Aminicenantes bacterium]
MKTLRGTPKHLSKTGELEGFTYLMLNFPFSCNYQCLKCFNLMDNHPVTTGNPLSLEEIRRTIKEANELGAKAVVIAGEGEPTSHKNIIEIVSLIDQLEMIPIIYSNGSTLNSRFAQKYHDLNVCLVIALDSLNPQVYNMLTNNKGDALSQVLKNLENIRRVYTDTVEYKNDLKIVRLALNMTVCSRNMSEIEDIKKIAGDDIYFVCNPLARSGNAVANWKKLVESEADFEDFQKLARKYSESGGPLTLNSSGFCGYSLNGIGIGPFGHYMTCAYTTETNGLLGTIRDRNLQDAYKLKTNHERKHYELHGQIPCLVRDLSFKDFLNSLRLKE